MGSCDQADEIENNRIVIIYKNIYLPISVYINFNLTGHGRSLTF